MVTLARAKVLGSKLRMMCLTSEEHLCMKRGERRWGGREAGMDGWRREGGREKEKHHLLEKVLDKHSQILGILHVEMKWSVPCSIEERLHVQTI